MKNNILFYFFISMLVSVNIYAQSENYAKFFNKGNKLFDNNFKEAEKNYRTAIDDSLSDLRASFNLSNKYYSEGLYEEAISRQIEATMLANNKSEKHSAYHNLGNSLMKKEMCSEAVLAYKNALRNNPVDDETRYNLALAKKCEEEQQNDDDENKGDEDKDDKDKDDENKGDEDKDDENKGDENKEDEDKDDQNKDDKTKDNQSKDNNKSDKPDEKNNQQSKLSPQQIKNLLKAMENAEKKVQAKVNDKKQKGIKVVSEKDW